MCSQELCRLLTMDRNRAGRDCDEHGRSRAEGFFEGIGRPDTLQGFDTNPRPEGDSLRYSGNSDPQNKQSVEYRNPSPK